MGPFISLPWPNFEICVPQALNWSIKPIFVIILQIINGLQATKFLHVELFLI